MTDQNPLLPPPAPSRPWPLATAIFAVLGVGALAAGLAVPAFSEPQPALAAPTASVPAPVTASPSPSRTPIVAASSVPDAAEVPISALADAAWVDRVSASAGIPSRALAAYAGAALAVSRSDPGCGLGWNTLAAIGLVETEHAGMNGATLKADGTVSPAIIGIPLDGNGVNVVRDTDRGAVDGDTVWDRAVGPMQFIPSTWAQAGRDGNRDGVTDVNQIDDAALATAEHLCEVGGDLTRPENWIAAVHAYNPSVQYNNRVAAAATQYAAVR